MNNLFEKDNILSDSMYDDASSYDSDMQMNDPIHHNFDTDVHNVFHSNEPHEHSQIDADHPHLHEHFADPDHSVSEHINLSDHYMPVSDHLEYRSSDGHYITITSDGLVIKDGAYLVGSVSNRNIYGKNGSFSPFVGYVAASGNIYDNHDNKVGWVDSNGHVYNSAGVNIYNTSGDIVSGAAYLLLVYLGGHP